VIAAEPLLRAPVAMDFDASGRMWVSEMPGYMANIQGIGENEPTGSIKILEDLDKDGLMDHVKIFMDSLVLPRALAHVYGGLLYAEPPNLYFVDINEDKPVNRVLVDSAYALDGNPEHQPNGLVMNIDNWIYSAKSNYRYRRKNGTWIKEPTTFRGQWGISHDNFGRLYYNDNSRQLLGDYVLPNRAIRNEFMQPNHIVNRLLTKDQRVYPIQATIVNRGYAAGVLNKDSLLINVTAACSPLVYRGGSFSKEYDENVFVCVPEANLIKRNILTFHGDSTSAEQAWQGKEFLVSRDEGFRPVNLYNGLDGSMYVVDMHRGVIGHHAYLSPYLKKKTKAVKMDTLVDFGRILRISKTNSITTEIPFFDTLNTAELLTFLKNKNGLVRDLAQQMLINRGDRSIIPELREVVKDSSAPLAQVHALYVLEDLDALNFNFLKGIAQSNSSKVNLHAIVLLERYRNRKNINAAKTLFEELLSRNNRALDFYISTTLAKWASISATDFYPLIYTLYNKYRDSEIFAEAIISGVNGFEDSLHTYLKDNFKGKDDGVLIKDLAEVLNNENEGNKNVIFTDRILAEDNRTRGAKLFRQICAACHGINGDGIEGLAPPLVNSEYMSHPMERLGLIMLHGLSGPVHVNGKLYELNQAMPGLIANEELSDKDISDIISYVTNSFSDKPKVLSANKIKKLRNLEPKGGEYTEEELLELFVK
ncbi:MAG: c-type cytochrome, partial [Maribacter sp.]